MIEKLKDPKFRKYIYQVISALIPVLIVFGVMIPGQSELILALVAALLGLGGSALANANTPVPMEDQEHEPIDVDSSHELGSDSAGVGEVPTDR